MKINSYYNDYVSIHGLKDPSSFSECIEYELQHGSPEERSIKILSKDN
ncbi:20714_t:CDS:2, partial [Gigaspora rosea]